MPEFFDPANLTEAQQSRWDGAMAEYQRIQQANRDMRGHDGNSFPCMGQAGHPKSALFARLLEGKPALPYAPPLSYAYPWYAIVEESGPHKVCVDLQSWSDGHITLNQCSWELKSGNAAWAELVRLQGALNQARTPLESGWTPELLSAVLKAYENTPQAVLAYPHWGEYRLRVGQGVSHAQWGYAQQRARGIQRLDVSSLAHCSSVFELERLSLNAEVGKVLHRGEHPVQRLERARARLAVAQSGADFAVMMEETSIARYEANLAQDIAAFEAAPDTTNVVEMFTDAWVLEKCDA